MIFTSYFGNQFIKELNMPLVSVCIATDIHVSRKRFLALAPTLEMTLKMLDLDNQGKSADCTELYTSHVLARLEPVATYHELDGSVLLGWEEPSKFCHRHIIASWLEEASGMPVLELDEAAAAALGTLKALRRIA